MRRSGVRLLAAWTCLGMCLAAAPAFAQEAEVSESGGSRAAEEQLIVRFGVGFDLAAGSLSGDADLQGNVFEDANVRSTTTFGTGELALGTRGLGLKTLNSYVLATTALDTDGNPSTTAVADALAEDATGHPSVFNRFDGARNILLHTAYAELDGLSSNKDAALNRVYLRAGRQFHWGLSALTFDGGTVGYNDGSLDIAARFGRRSGVYNVAQDDPGLVGGLTASYDLRKSADVPLMFRLEFVHFQREVTLLAPDQPLEDNAEKVDVTVDTGELAAYLDIGESGRIDAAFALLGASPSHGRLGLTWGFGQSAIFIDLDQKLGPDLFYDIAGGGSKEIDGRLFTYETYRLNIPDRQPYSDIRARAEIAASEELVISPLAGYHAVLADDNDRTAFDADRAFWGLGARLDLKVDNASGFSLYGDYAGQLTTREGGTTVEDSDFFDVAAGADTSMHEVSGGVEYTRGRRFVRGRMLGDRTLTLGLGGFFRTYVLSNRYLTEDLNEDYGGAQASVRWEAGKYFGVRGVYEFARDSSVFARSFGDFHGVRAGVEGRF